MRLIDVEKLVTDIQGTQSQVAMDAPYDADWFSRLADRQFEILQLVKEATTVDAEPVIHCKDCTIKKAVQHEDGMIWRCPLRTTDIKPEGFCECGRRTDENLGRS